MNGEAERAVQTVKNRYGEKPWTDSLPCLTTGRLHWKESTLSPAQLLMGRRPRNKLPASEEVLAPCNAQSQRSRTAFQ